MMGIGLHLLFSARARRRSFSALKNVFCEAKVGGDYTQISDKFNPALTALCPLITFDVDVFGRSGKISACFHSFDTHFLLS